MLALQYLWGSGGMADATDLKSVIRKGVRVQVPPPPPYGWIAQLVEHETENLGVPGSIPGPATICRDSTAGSATDL